MLLREAPGGAVEEPLFDVPATRRLISCCSVASSSQAPPTPQAAPNAAPSRAKFSAAASRTAFFFHPATIRIKPAAIPCSIFFTASEKTNSSSLIPAAGTSIQDLWDQKRIGEFLIATPAADRSFYINSRDGRVRYEDFFAKEFSPFIESHYRIRADRAHRGITGVSMGGYGALRFAFRYPQLFGSVSAHSAALIANLPRIEMPGTQQNALSFALGGAFGNPFDPAFWKRNSPFTIVRNRPRLVGMHIYFDCGTEDDYGFNNGAQAFHDLLLSRGIPHEFHLYPGGHNEAYFAQHLPASLEFQSRAFGLSPGK